MVMFIVCLFFSLSTALAQTCWGPGQCQSPLVKVQLGQSALEDPSGHSLTALGSPLLALKAQDLPVFTIPTITLPTRGQACALEKKINPLFAQVDCNNKKLCVDSSVPKEVREKICYGLMCQLLEGDKQSGYCQSETTIFPTELSFGPLQITDLKLSHEKVSVNNGEAEICVTIESLALSTSVDLSIDVGQSALKDKTIHISNIRPALDSPPRLVCAHAHLEIGSPNPISNLRIEFKTPLISTEMLAAASPALQIDGLQGYSAKSIKDVQSALVPVLLQPLLQSTEDAIASSLERVIERQSQKLANGEAQAGVAKLINIADMSSELGFANIEAKGLLSELECLYARDIFESYQVEDPRNPLVFNSAEVPIPELRPYLKECKPWQDQRLAQEMDDCKRFRELDQMSQGGRSPRGCDEAQVRQNMVLKLDSDTHFKEQGFNEFIEKNNVTSQDIERRLIALRELVKNKKFNLDDPIHEEFERNTLATRIAYRVDTYIDPNIQMIQQKRAEANIPNLLALNSRISNHQTQDLTAGLAELCDEASTIIGREVKDCPTIQLHADLSVLNKMLKRMWENGQMCKRGRGAYAPSNPRYGDKGQPLGSGCFIEMQGMGCYVNSPPRIEYDKAHNRYAIPEVDLLDCFHWPDPIIQLGAAGADFKIGLTFNPTLCSNGDFCLSDMKITQDCAKEFPCYTNGRFALREKNAEQSESPLKGVVVAALKKASGALGSVIRIPLTTGVKDLENVPIHVRKLDKGEGYFGVCAEIDQKVSK